MTLVVKSPSTFNAFTFEKTDNGTNFKALEKEVEDFGGKVYFPNEEQQDVVVLEVLGHIVTLTLGFGVLIGDKGTTKILPVTSLAEQYAPFAGSSSEVSDLIARVASLEEQLIELKCPAPDEDLEEEPV